MEALKDYLPNNRWTNGNWALCTQEETLLGGKTTFSRPLIGGDCTRSGKGVIVYNISGPTLPRIEKLIELYQRFLNKSKNIKIGTFTAIHIYQSKINLFMSFFCCTSSNNKYISWFRIHLCTLCPWEVLSISI